jgi:hypothetical protein
VEQRQVYSTEPPTKTPGQRQDLAITVLSYRPDSLSAQPRAPREPLLVAVDATTLLHHNDLVIGGECSRGH